ncbi:Trihelix transcription factor [Quillaja saponaria]|uniref:Trihelix transcription factor n=1 Tax=Quillaja saponaria TaxID=32244 RepID=A0AAD7VNR4_QUISA|nr:Trihelix transcription factor [Quillaja saponaria]
MDKETTHHDQPSLLSNNNTNTLTAIQESPRKPIGGVNSSGGDRLKRDEWSEGAVSSLLEAYETKWVLRNRAKLKGHDWEDVARHVSSRGNSTKSSKTQTQCKNKIESMKKRYRSESATADGSSWPLYSRLDLLLRGTGPPPGQPLPATSVSPHTPPPPLPQLAAVPFSNQPLMLLESSPVVLQPLPAPLLTVPPPQLNAQNSNGSNGVDKLAKEDGLGTKSSDHVTDKNRDPLETDSSTPALYSDKDKFRCNKRKMKMENNNSKRQKKEEMEIAESIRWLAEVVVKSEQARMDTMKEIEKMRVEAEAKRGEMDLKRTEIIANTQLEIAKIFASVNKGVDSSLRIGRS